MLSITLNKLIKGQAIYDSIYPFNIPFSIKADHDSPPASAPLEIAAATAQYVLDLFECV